MPRHTLPTLVVVVLAGYATADDPARFRVKDAKQEEDAKAAVARILLGEMTPAGRMAALSRYIDVGDEWVAVRSSVRSDDVNLGAGDLWEVTQYGPGHIRLILIIDQAASWTVTSIRYVNREGKLEQLRSRDDFLARPTMGSPRHRGIRP